MGIYKYIREAWKKPKENLKEIWRERLNAWKREPVTIRIERPTRLDRARSLGYKAKPGYIIVRQRVIRGGRQRSKVGRGGRRSKHFGLRKDVDINYQSVAEERAVKSYVNCEVLNSYYVGHDGKYFWYEVILVDRMHPQIMADERINWICSQRGRAFRGITSAGRKSRGFRHKGKGTEHLRPSRSADRRRRDL